MPVETFSDFARDRISKQQKDTLARIGIVFDVYFREQSLYETGAVWRGRWSASWWSCAATRC